MISRIRGLVREVSDLQLLLEVNGISYEIFVPPSVLRALPERLGPGGDIELVTFHYQQLDVGRGIPVLIGFLNEIEREFFERFITVAGIGPKAALKALTQPIAVIAQAIDEGDLVLLKSLPGIGDQRAREIVAKLQGKVGKFGLIQTKADGLPGAAQAPSAVEEEVLAVLLRLEYKKPEAKQMIQTALERNPKAKTAEDLLNEIYRQHRMAAEPA